MEDPKDLDFNHSDAGKTIGRYGFHLEPGHTPYEFVLVEDATGRRCWVSRGYHAFRAIAFVLTILDARDEAEKAGVQR